MCFFFLYFLFYLLALPKSSCPSVVHLFSVRMHMSYYLLISDSSGISRDSNCTGKLVENFERLSSLFFLLFVVLTQKFLPKCCPPFQCASAHFLFLLISQSP